MVANQQGRLRSTKCCYCTWHGSHLGMLPLQFILTAGHQHRRQPPADLTRLGSEGVNGKSANTKAPVHTESQCGRRRWSVSCSRDWRTAHSRRSRTNRRRAIHGCSQLSVRGDHCLPHTASHANPNTTPRYSPPCRITHNHSGQMIPPDWCRDTRWSRKLR